MHRTMEENLVLATLRRYRLLGITVCITQCKKEIPCIFSVVQKQCLGVN